MHSSHQTHLPDDPGLLSAGHFCFSISGPEIRSPGPRGPILTLASWDVSVPSWMVSHLAAHVVVLLALGRPFVLGTEPRGLRDASSVEAGF